MKLASTAKYLSLSPWLAAAPIAVLAGAVASTGDLKLIALFFGALVGLVAALFPTALFWLAITISIVLAGTAQLYFPSLELIRWAVVPISVLLVIHLLIQAFQSSLQYRNPGNTPPILWLLLAFMLVNLITAFVNQQNLASLAIGLKGYFQLWGVLFWMALLNRNHEIMEHWLPKVVLLLALIQVPFALHQYLFIAPIRHNLEQGIVPLDIVTGTFGGSINGGGANAALAVFLLVVWSCILALWKNHAISTPKTLLLSAILLMPVMINEAKVSIIYAVAIFIVVFRHGIVRDFSRFVGVSIMIIGVVAVMFITYIRHAPEGKVDSWTGLITYTVEYNLMKDEQWDGKLSRGGSIKLWLQEHGSTVNTLLGYGVGVTRSESQSGLTKRLGIKDPQSFGVGNLAAIAVLWESGVIGFGIVTALFWVGFRSACLLERRYVENARQSAIFLGLQGAVVILYISLWHKNFFLFHIAYQAVLVLLFGYLIYWLRQTVQADNQAYSRD
jgi:hypothetical protein